MWTTLGCTNRIVDFIQELYSLKGRRSSINFLSLIMFELFLTIPTVRTQETAKKRTRGPVTVPTEVGADPKAAISVYLNGSPA